MDVSSTLSRRGVRDGESSTFPGKTVTLCVPSKKTPGSVLKRLSKPQGGEGRRIMTTSDVFQLRTLLHNQDSPVLETDKVSTVLKRGGKLDVNDIPKNNNKKNLIDQTSGCEKV